MPDKSKDGFHYEYVSAEGITPDPPQLPAQSTIKECPRCRRELPVTVYYFDRDAKNDDGFKPHCKDCRAEIRRKKDGNNTVNRMKRIDKNLLKAIDEADVSDPNNMAHVMDLYEAGLRVVGGAGALMQRFWAEYTQAPVGGVVRQRYIMRMLDMAKTVTEMGMTEQSLSEMSNEQLEKVHAEFLTRIKKIDVGGQQFKVIPIEPERQAS